MNDNEIIQLLFNKSEKAIVEINKQYGKLCHTLAFNILKNRQDAEECVNDAYLGVWNTIPPKRPNSFTAYLCRLVRNLSVNRYKYNAAEKRKTNYNLCLEEIERYFGTTELLEKITEKELTGYIETFLDSLTAQERFIFVRRFWYLDSYKSIAKATGLKEGALRVKMTRLKAELKKNLDKQGVVV